MILSTFILIIHALSFEGNCGDVNNSGTINILDITYLINYVYKGGPEPDCGPTGTVTAMLLSMGDCISFVRD
jgi:hypothetical protein